MNRKTPEEQALATAGRFREYSKLRNITLKEVSEKSGVPYSTVRRFETAGEISFVSLIGIASALGLDEQIAALFSELPPTTLEELFRMKLRGR